MSDAPAPYHHKVGRGGLLFVLPQGWCPAWKQYSSQILLLFLVCDILSVNCKVSIIEWLTSHLKVQTGAVHHPHSGFKSRLPDLCGIKRGCTVWWWWWWCGSASSLHLLRFGYWFLISALSVLRPKTNIPSHTEGLFRNSWMTGQPLLFPNYSQKDWNHYSHHHHHHHHASCSQWVKCYSGSTAHFLPLL